MRKDRLKRFLSNTSRIYKSLFEKPFWVKLFALKPSFFFKTRFLPQSRKACTIQRHIIPIFSKPCQINGRYPVPRVFNLQKGAALFNGILSLYSANRVRLMVGTPFREFSTCISRLVEDSRLRRNRLIGELGFVEARFPRKKDTNGSWETQPLSSQCRSLWIDKSTAPRDHSLLLKTGSKA